MENRIRIISVFLSVTAASLVGMTLGGTFGYIAGRIAPDLFTHVIPWKDIEPVGAATIVGAFGGVMCGGALGVFAILIKTVSEWPKKKHDNDTT